MADTTERALRLLGLFETRSVWTGPELVELLGVTTRTLRRDVGRLRDLGYPVEATSGVGGGYRLGTGGRLPPLLLEEDAESFEIRHGKSLTRRQYQFLATEWFQAEHGEPYRSRM